MQRKQVERKLISSNTRKQEVVIVDEKVHAPDSDVDLNSQLPMNQLPDSAHSRCGKYYDDDERRCLICQGVT